MSCICLFPQETRFVRGVEKLLPCIRRRDRITQTVDDVYRAGADLCNIIQGINFIKTDPCLYFCDELCQRIDNRIWYEKIKLIIQRGKRTIYKQRFYLWELRGGTDQCCCSHGTAPCADVNYLRLRLHIIKRGFYIEHFKITNH